MDLESIRKNIDKIDNELIELFKKRMDCAEQVALYKKEHNMPILNTKRENEILENVGEKGGKYGYAAQLLFSNIMELSRELQHDIIGSGRKIRSIVEDANYTPNSDSNNLKIACQGIAGANSHIAALNLFPCGKKIFYKSFGDVFAAIESGEADFGVLPVENSSAGSVTDVYDLMLKYRFYITEALNLKIDHCLAALPQCTLDDIEQVWSHPQALSQCSNFIANNSLYSVPAANTAIAAKNTAKEKRLNVAAICSEEAAKAYGLKVLLKGIQNSKENSTRFIVISKKLFIPDDSDKISLCFSLPHVKGSLYNVLGRFSSHGMNLTKIESRPKPGAGFEYMFYLDFTGNVRKANALKLLCALSEEMPEFSFLGNYKELDR